MLKFSSKPLVEHAEVPPPDAGRLEKLVAHWTERQQRPAIDATPGSACYVASVGPGRDPVQRGAQMAEILALVHGQGGRVVGQEIAHLAEPNPRTLLGKGAARDLASRARAAGATMLVIDAELSPSQTRNLEDVAGIPICDREAIILNVFLRNARTRRARIQVEIAQLQYLRPRIRGVGLDMDQQAGGMARGRGPGETASELLARKLDGRVVELEKALRKLETSGRTQRRQRHASKRLVLVGYTNAGKTSLMNALTSADLSARDAPFETLDTTSRCISRHGGQVLLSDTIGFIRRLPERLLASFDSTLAEITEASLLVLVVDASDPERELHIKATLQVIAKIGAAEVPRFYVFNKRDRLPAVPDEPELARWSGGRPWALLSAADPGEVDALKDALIRAVRGEDEALTAFVPYAAKDVLALVYGRCRVLDSVAAEDGLTLAIQGPAPVVARIRRRLEGGTS
jgi:GTP-binding protein HflX